MIALYLLFWVVYLGTPLLIIGWWIWLRRPAWPMATALGLWLLQFAVWAVMVLGCLGGHCRLSALQEYGPYALTVVAYVAIGALLWLAWRRSRGASG